METSANNKLLSFYIYYNKYKRSIQKNLGFEGKQIKLIAFNDCVVSFSDVVIMYMF